MPKVLPWMVMFWNGFGAGIAQANSPGVMHEAGVRECVVLDQHILQDGTHGAVVGIDPGAARRTRRGVIPEEVLLDDRLVHRAIVGQEDADAVVLDDVVLDGRAARSRCEIDAAQALTAMGSLNSHSVDDLYVTLACTAKKCVGRETTQIRSRLPSSPAPRHVSGHPRPTSGTTQSYHRLIDGNSGRQVYRRLRPH